MLMKFRAAVWQVGWGVVLVVVCAAKWRKLMSGIKEAEVGTRASGEQLAAQPVMVTVGL